MTRAPESPHLEDWPGDSGPPIPLDDGAVPPWPEGMLSEPIEEYVGEVAEFVQVPRDLPAMVALGVLSVCWAGKVRAIPFEGYEESLSLYCVAVADVGERKSATYAKFEAPIRAYEAERRDELLPLQSDYAADRARLEAQLKRVTESRGKPAADGAQPDTDSRDEARKVRRELTALRPPPRPDFLTGDCTAEGLARLMSETGGFACLTGPEGGGIFDVFAGKYSDRIPNLDVFLKSYDSERLVVHRANREREYPPVEHPALVLNVTTQPATLRRLAERPELMDRGLVPRMIFAIPSGSRVGFRAALKPPIPHDISESFNATILRMLRFARPEVPHVLHFSEDARAEFVPLHDAIEIRLRSQGDLAKVRGWAGKLIGKIVRIAALLHLTDCRSAAEPWTVPVSRDAFKRAALLTDYLIAHFHRAGDLMALSPHILGARKLLDGLERDRQRRFTMRYAQRVVAHNTSKDAARPVLDLLCSHNYIARTAGPRRDSEVWLVHPSLVERWGAQPASSPLGTPGTVGTLQ